MVSKEQQKWGDEQEETMTKILIQLELLTKYVMGSPTKSHGKNDKKIGISQTRRRLPTRPTTGKVEIKVG